MTLFMAGYPFSGKTFILDKILAKLPDDAIVVNLSPKHFFESTLEGDDIKDEDLSEAVRAEYMLSAWECSLEKLKEFIEDCSPEDVIIYDSGCASHTNMELYFKLAQECGHRVIYLLVNCKVGVCERRAAGKLTKDIFKSYTEKFKRSIPILGKLSDNRIVIDNNIDEEVPDVSKVVELINGRIR